MPRGLAPLVPRRGWQGGRAARVGQERGEVVTREPHTARAQRRGEQHSIRACGEPLADASLRALRREHERTSVAPGLDALETPQGLADAGHGFASGREIGAEHGRRVEPAREIEEPRPEGVLVGDGLGRDDQAEVAPLGDPRHDALEHGPASAARRRGAPRAR